MENAGRTPQAQKAGWVRLRPAGAQPGALWHWPPHLAIVADEHHAVAGVYGPRTEITFLDTHVERAWGPTTQTPSLKGNDVAPSQEVIFFPVPTRKRRACCAPEGPWKENRTRLRPLVTAPAKTLSLGAGAELHSQLGRPVSRKVKQGSVEPVEVALSQHLVFLYRTQ